MPDEPIPVNILAEDTICEYLARKLLLLFVDRFSIGVSYPGNGFGYIKKNLDGFNRASDGVPFFAIADLVGNCPVTQISQWLPHGQNRNMLFRIVVKESEAWILADKEGFSSFLGISRQLIPDNVDNIFDPKSCLINLVRRSRRRNLREALVPRPNTTAEIGPDYNARLSEFVIKSWDPNRAAQNSSSLKRAISALKEFSPIIEVEHS
jgi:hypothetical protein